MILEVGCGFDCGVQSDVSVDNGRDWDGNFDLMIQQLREVECDLSKLVIADVNKLPFKDRVFDKVTSSRFIGRNPRAGAWKELNRVLKEGATIEVFSAHNDVIFHPNRLIGMLKYFPTFHSEVIYLPSKQDYKQGDLIMFDLVLYKEKKWIDPHIENPEAIRTAIPYQGIVDIPEGLLDTTIITTPLSEEGSHLTFYGGVSPATIEAAIGSNLTWAWMGIAHEIGHLMLEQIGIQPPPHEPLIQVSELTWIEPHLDKARARQLQINEALAWAVAAKIYKAADWDWRRAQEMIKTYHCEDPDEYYRVALRSLLPEAFNK